MPQWDADQYRGAQGRAQFQALQSAAAEQIAAQNGGPTFEQFTASVKPGMLDQNGQFNAPTAGVNYKLEGKTVDQAYNDAVAQWQKNQEANAGAPTAYQNKQDLATELNPAWRQGAVSTGDMWTVPLAMLAAPFAAAAVGAGAAAGTTAATPATGLAGQLGMNAGMGATALNTGAFNTGMSLLRGQNIGDSLKSGLTSAALSPVGTMAGNAVGSALSDYGLTPTQLNAVKTIANNTAIGGVQGGLTGKGVGAGLQTGLVNGLVNAAGNYVGSEAKLATGSNAAGTAANTLTQAYLRGGVNDKTLNTLAQQYATGELTDLSGLDPQVVSAVVTMAAGLKNPAGALTQIAKNYAGGQLKNATVGAPGALTQTAKKGA